MGLRDVVKQQVANAFIQLDDLKQTIVFNNTSSRSYDFATGDVSESKSSLSVEGVVEYITVNEDSSILDNLKVRFIVNKVDLPGGYTQFDDFTTDGKTYKIVNYVDNGYTVEGTGVGE